MLKLSHRKMTLPNWGNESLYLSFISAKLVFHLLSFEYLLWCHFIMCFFIMCFWLRCPCNKWLSAAQILLSFFLLFFFFSFLLGIVITISLNKTELEQNWASRPYKAFALWPASEILRGDLACWISRSWNNNNTKESMLWGMWR